MSKITVKAYVESITRGGANFAASSSRFKSYPSSASWYYDGYDDDWYSSGANINRRNKPHKKDTTTEVYISTKHVSACDEFSQLEKLLQKYKHLHHLKAQCDFRKRLLQILKDMEQLRVNTMQSIGFFVYEPLSEAAIRTLESSLRKLLGKEYTKDSFKLALACLVRKESVEGETQYVK